MKTLICFCIVLLFATQAFAKGDIINVPGESAHVAGGAAMAGLATAVANKYWPEHRALIGFSFSTAIGIIGEGMDRNNHGEKFSFMFEDVAFNTLGKASGSLITDKFILMPVIERDHAGSAYYGLVFQCRL
jgi:hypothetical protein